MPFDSAWFSWLTAATEMLSIVDFIDVQEFLSKKWADIHFIANYLNTNITILPL
jgi:hypothetical protein